MSRLSQFCADIAVAFRRLIRPEPQRASRPCHCQPGHKRTLIVAHNFPQAREHARVNGLTDWVCVRSWEQLVGYHPDRIHLVKLEGWERGAENGDFWRQLGRLERELAAHVWTHE